MLLKIRGVKVFREQGATRTGAQLTLWSMTTGSAVATQLSGNLRTTLKMLFIFVGLVGCHKGSLKEESLDVTLPKKSLVEDSSQASSQKTQTQSSSDFTTEISWEDFFRPPPSNSEFDKLLANLEKPDKPNMAPRDLMDKASKEFALGRFDESQRTVRALLRQEKKNLDALLLLIVLTLKKREITQTFDLLSEMKAILDENADQKPSLLFRYKYVLALAYLEKGAHGRAHKILSDLIGADRSFTPGYAALASSYIQLKKESAAEFILKRGIERGKKDPALYNLMGVIWWHKGYSEEALNWYDKALNICENCPGVLINKGVLLTAQREYEDAGALLRKAIKVEPSSDQAYFALGLLQTQTQDLEGAYASLEKALELNPEDGRIRFTLAQFYEQKLKRKDDAQRLFQEVVQISRHDEDLKNLAQARLESFR